MKRRNRSLYLAVGINLRELLGILIFLIYSLNSYSQENKNVLLICGTQNYEHSTARELVAEEWNIEIIQVAGSTVGKHQLDSINSENSKLWDKLDETIPNSKESFYQDVTKKLRPIWDSANVIDSNKRLQRKLKRYETDSTFTTRKFKRIEENGNVIWTIIEIKRFDYSSENEELFDLEVDWKKEKLSIINRPN